VDTDPIDALCASLDRLQVGWTRVSRAQFAEALLAAVEAPAVAAPWPFDDRPPGWNDLPNATIPPVSEGAAQPINARPINARLGGADGPDASSASLPESTQGGTLLDGTALEQARTGVSAARLAIASYGSLVLDYDGAGEAVSLLPTRHVAVVRATDVVPDMKAAFQRIGPLLRARPSSLVLATGPSATADMGALVRGAHGPETVHVLILET